MITTRLSSLSGILPSPRRARAGRPVRPARAPRNRRKRVGSELREQLPDELVDELLAGARTKEQLVGPGGVLAGLRKRLLERTMEVELTTIHGYEQGQSPPGGAGNTRNGSTPKTLATEHGPVGSRRRVIAMELRAEDRAQAPTPLRGLRRKIIALLPRALDPRYPGVPGQPLCVEVGRDLISRVTDAVMDDASGVPCLPADRCLCRPPCTRWRCRVDR